MKKNWNESYRPRTLNGYVYNTPAHERIVGQIIETGNLPNLMFTGIRGTGKTTLAGAILNELKIPKEDVLKVNCSDQKIDYIRSTVIPFARSMPDGDIRVVRLEEFDYLSKDAQALLRSFIEESHSNCRFIATCNYPAKVLPELRSRFTELDFGNPDYADIATLAFNILDTEGVKYSVDDVCAVIEGHYPDIRSIINYLEANTSNNTLVVSESNTTTAEWEEAIDAAIKRKNLFAIRGTLQQMSGDDIAIMLKKIQTSVMNHSPECIMPVIRALAEFEFRLTFVGDAELQIAALFVELDMILNGQI